MRRVAALAVAAALPFAAGCGGGGDGGGKAGARKAVQTYFAALAAKDAAGACKAFSDPSREKLAEFGHEHLKTAKSCPAVLDLLLKSPAGGSLGKLRHAKVTSVDLKSAKQAEVRVKGLDRPVDLTLVDGAWRIASEPSGETD